jgi:hypothetical protein
MTVLVMSKSYISDYTFLMKFNALQENLRKILWKRILDGELTGMRLAKQTGFQQAHISNFLNRKRGLSLEGMDKVLVMQHLSVLDLLDPAEINKRASIVPPSEDEFENVLLVKGSVAAGAPLVTEMKVKSILKFEKALLRSFRPQAEGDRRNWLRFVAIRLDGREGMSMFPRTLPGATVLIDRHYNSLKPYRKNDSSMYAVNKQGECVVKYVEAAGDHLVLRPHNHGFPVEIMSLPPGKKPSDYLVGRVCYVGVEV